MKSVLRAQYIPKVFQYKHTMIEDIIKLKRRWRSKKNDCWRGFDEDDGSRGLSMKYWEGDVVMNLL